tara:strand:+ start:36 stop:584 length:549 start_codon:yes stop_codon:yes gene_type:complete
MPKPPKKSKRFVYNLQSALNFRELRESQEQEKYNEAEKKYNQELEKENVMKEQEKLEKSALLEEISEGKTLDFQQVLMRKAHLEQLKIEIEDQIKVREQAEEDKNTQLEVLVQAMKDRKILDEDKEKKRGMWRDIMKKEEMKFLDEIASIGFAKRAREEEEIQRKLKEKVQETLSEDFSIDG